MLRRLALVFFAALLAFSLAACGGKGYSRGIFHGLVIEKTQEEVKAKLGEPFEVQKFDEDNVRFVYKGKTFDPDNANQVDDRTIIEFARKDGKLIVVDVTFG